jgi:hypothetical protein
MWKQLLHFELDRLIILRVTAAVLVRCHQKHMFIVILTGKEPSLYLLRSYRKYSYQVKRMEKSGCGTDA